MRGQNFKIRKPLLTGINKLVDEIECNDSRARSEVQGHRQENITQNNQLQSQMKQLMTMFELFMKQSLLNNQTKNTNSQVKIVHNPATIEYESRDRLPIIDLPNFNEQLGATNTVSNSEIEKWITNLCNATFSSAFNYYLNDKLSYEHARTYCSQSILTNLLRFTQKFKLNQEQLELIDQHMKTKIIPYLQKKYPLTLSNLSNKQLQKQVQQTNHLDLLSNDFLYIFGFMFEYRQNGNYNDMIMRLMNKTMQLIDAPSIYANDFQEDNTPNIDYSNYKDFQLFMTQIFEKVYDQDWIGVKHNKFQDKISSILSNQEHLKVVELNKKKQTIKQQYRQKVKSYTSYLIGRKISENTENYSQKQIRSQNLKIKSVAVLRILTKWCEELWQKFDKENYFTQRTESIQLQKPEFVNPFFKWMKTGIDALMAAEKVNVLAFMKDLQKNAFHQQSSLLFKNLIEDDVNFIPRMEKAYGKFSIQMVKHLHSYIVLYLNRLIHGLLTVAKKFYDKSIDKSWQEWQAPPNLLTFKIGDLMRCKCSSKQRQIVKIFKEIKKISNTKPNKLKIVRIKNRLRSGTNDILINVKFNNLMICQIQLGVNVNQSKFITCSNNFSHYLYELQRSIFGPVFELCSIWNSLDPRAGQYEKLIMSQQAKRMILPSDQNKISKCGENEHKYVVWNLPFQCHKCNIVYYHNDYILSNKRCQICLNTKCVRCQIDEMDETTLKKQLFKGKKNSVLIEDCQKLKDNKIPTAGVCIYISSNTIDIQKFNYVKVEGKYYLFGVKEDKLYQIKKVGSPKQKDDFFRSYCIFSIKSSSQNAIKIDDKRAFRFRMEQYLKQALDQEQQVLILTQIRFNCDQMKTLMNVEGQKYEKSIKKVQRIQYASNYLDRIDYFQKFENITKLNLDYNSFTSTLPVSCFKSLQKLEMRQNSSLTQIEAQFCKLQRLEEVKFSNCGIYKIDDNIGKLHSLQILRVENNKIDAIPQTIGDLANLRTLMLTSNRLKNLPESIGRLGNLQKLTINKNTLKQLPKYLGNLQNLVYFDCSQNQISQIEDNLQSLLKLQEIYLGKNQFTNFPKTLSLLPNLKIISITSNKIVELPQDMSKWTKLRELLISQNKIKVIPESIRHCLQLQKIQLKFNQIQEIAEGIGKLKKLNSKIQLNNNKLQQFPKGLFQLQHLEQLILNQNSISEIPNQISKLLELRVLQMQSNKLKCIPQTITLLTELKSFSYSSNEITSIPTFLQKLPSFTYANRFISFSKNHISELPSDLFSESDTEITFTSNHLVQIPLSLIIKKQNLTNLNLSLNKITVIPREIKQLANLCNLNLSSNLIEQVPIELANLIKINSRCLKLELNPIKNIECEQFVKSKGSFETIELVKKIQIQRENNKKQQSQNNNQTGIDKQIT